MIIDGKMVSQEIKNRLNERVYNLKKAGITPGLAVIIVGNDPASKIYVRNKKRACAEIGIYSEEYSLPENTTQEELLKIIHTLNQSKKIHGILTQLPLPAHIDNNVIAQAILPEKDVDCFHEINIGKIFLGTGKLLPCTPAGIIELLNYYKIEIPGKNCTIVGRSNIVGKPLALMMLKENATAVICHSKTTNLESFCKNADILISAVGKEKFITSNMVKPESVVIDVGMNRDKSGKLCGDVDFYDVNQKVSFITPVPGGVGPMTIAMLLKNVVCAAENVYFKINLT